MGYLYKAIQREMGLTPQEEEVTDAGNVPATQAVSGGAAVAPATESSVRAVQAVAEVVTARPVPRNTLKLAEIPEKLVALPHTRAFTNHAAAVEQTRVMRARLVEAIRVGRLKTIMITSAMPAEGKTLMSVNIAYALSQLESKRVLLVDCDLRNPSVAGFLGMEFKRGLSDVIAGTCTVDEALWSAKPNLDILPCLTATAETADVAYGDRLQRFLQEMAAHYDLVLIDAPPLFPIADTHLLAPMVDGALLVVRAGVTEIGNLKEAAELLKRKLIGTILNCAKAPRKAKKLYGRYAIYGGGTTG